MTATDELRALLDERGVKWEADYADKYIHNHTQFEPNCNVAVDVWECDGELMVEVETAHCFTAIEVIEATLGRGTCCEVGTISNDYGYAPTGTEYDTELSCGHHWHSNDGILPDYCPWCGRRVVNADE